MRTTLSEVVPPPENFPMYAYTAVPFSMLSDCIDWNILISDLQQMSDGLTKSPMFCLLLVIQRAKRDKFISRMAASMLLLLCGERCWWTNGGIKWRTCHRVICWHDCQSVLRSKHLPWLVELHSGNQSHMELTVSTIAEIATFEPNFERLILVQRILMPANSQTLFVWASRRGCLRKRSITSCVQCQGTANSVPQDLLAIVGRVQRYCRS